MLGTVSTDTNQLRAERDELRERLHRIESALDSVKCAVPEYRAPRIHSLVTVCDREIRSWREGERA